MERCGGTGWPPRRRRRRPPAPQVPRAARRLARALRCSAASPAPTSSSGSAIGAFVVVLAALVARHRARRSSSRSSCRRRRPWSSRLDRAVPDAGYAYDIGISIARVWVAFLASAVIAIPLGMLMSSYRGGRRLHRAAHRLRPLPAGAGAGAAHADLARHRRRLEDRAALDRHLLPARAARRRRCAARAEGVHRDRAARSARTTAR